MSLNKVLLIGHLGADPDVRHAQDGKAVTNFRLATNEHWDKDGVRQQRTEWHRIVSFGRVAEICGEYLKKGRKVFVEGSLRSRSWEDKDGVKRWITEIIARNVHMLGPKRTGAQLDPVPEEFPDGDAPF